VMASSVLSSVFALSVSRIYFVPRGDMSW
jgi:hypothetical protein